LLLSANVGEGLFFAGSNHVALQVVASPEEHRLVTTKPSEILAMREERKQVAAETVPTPTPPTPSKPIEPPSPPSEDNFQQKIRQQLEELDEVKEKAKEEVMKVQETKVQEQKEPEQKRSTLAERFESENLTRRSNPPPR